MTKKTIPVRDHHSVVSMPSHADTNLTYEAAYNTDTGEWFILPVAVRTYEQAFPFD
jgi:hypothetical protein